MSRLIDLPQELQDTIYSLLGAQGLLLLRLTDRALWQATARTFEVRFFSTVQLLVTSDALSKLGAVASHDQLRVNVRELVIVPTIFENSHGADVEALSIAIKIAERSARPFHEVRAAGGEERQIARQRHEAFEAAKADYESAISSSRFLEVLTHSIRQFSALRSIGMAAFAERRHDKSSRSRSNDDEKDDDNDDERTHPRPWGWHRIRNEVGLPPSAFSKFTRGYSIPTDCWQPQEHVFSSLLKAIGAAPQPLASFRTCGKASPCKHVGLSAFDLSEPEQAATLRALGSLEHLHLCIRVRTDRPQDGAARSFLNDVIVVAASSLRTLQLAHFIPYRYLAGEQRLAGLGFNALLVGRGTHFPRLESLDLSQLRITSTRLRSFLCTAAPSLKFLTLVRIDLLDDDEEKPRNLDSACRNWQRLCREVAGQLELLASFQILNPFGNEHVLRAVDGIHGPGGTHPFTTDPDVGLYYQESGVSLKSWAEQLVFEGVED